MGAEPGPLPGAGVRVLDAYWRAANYLSAGQIYLMANPLLAEPLRAEHIKPRLLGHWGTSPGLDEVSDGLEHAAGLAGLAGLPGGSGDMREVRLAAARGNPGARLAIEVHAHRLRAQIAAMAAALGGLDTLVFTGGIGEHQPEVRAEAAAGLAFLGVAVDQGRNATAQPDCDISVPGTAVRTLVMNDREDIEIARQTRATLAAA